MEGGNVHRVRLVEHGRGQERDERLVEVQHVELVLLEQLARLLLEAQAEGDTPDAAVCRRRPARAQPDDVPLALTLSAVLAGDDPDVVAHASHGVMREMDVLVYAARVRIPVRAHDPDLQWSPIRSLDPDRWHRWRRCGLDRCHRHSPVGRRVWRRCRALATSWRRYTSTLWRLLQKAPSGRVVRASTAARYSAADAPGNQVHAVPMPSSTCASEFPTAASWRTVSFMRSRAPRRALPAADGLKSSTASSRWRGSVLRCAWSSERAPRDGVSGAMGCAAMAIPPWSWMRSSVSGSGRSAGIRSLMKRASTCPRRVVISS